MQCGVGRRDSGLPTRPQLRNSPKTEAASNISSALELLQAAIKARAWAMEEHRAQDETGGNGRDITRAFDRALADVGISTQVHWHNSLTGRDCSRILEKAPEIFKAMTTALQAKGIPDADIRGYLKKHQEPLLVLLKIVPLISAARLLTDNELEELDREAYQLRTGRCSESASRARSRPKSMSLWSTSRRWRGGLGALAFLAKKALSQHTPGMSR